MYEGDEDTRKRKNKLIPPWQSTIYEVWEKPLLYLRKPNYLNIYFNTHFCITEIHTNHEYLKQLYTNEKIPKTLYRIINPERHSSILDLFYQFRYVSPKKLDRIHLQFNNSYLRAYGHLKVLTAGKKYCFKLKIHSLRHSERAHLYQKVPLHKRQIAYRLYTDIHQVSFQKTMKIASIFEVYPYSQTSLYVAFKNVIGVHPSVVWRDRRLLSFIQHLLQTEDSIMNIYPQYGFSNASHLYKYFKTHFNTTPISFRKKYKDK